MTVASFEEMEPIYDGLARQAQATLGVRAFGMRAASATISSDAPTTGPWGAMVLNASASA